MVRFVTRVGLSTVFLAGCAGDVSTELTQTGGCGNVLMYAANAADTLALWVDFNSLAYFAVEAEQPLNETWDLNRFNRGEHRIAVLEGEGVTADFCTDVFGGTEPSPRRRYNPLSGEVSVSIVPDEDADYDEPYSEATLSVQDAVFVSLLGARRAIDSLTFTAMVGWESD